MTISPNTAFNSCSKKNTIFKNVFKNWDLINQYTWGIKNTPMKIDTQFNIIE